MVAKDAPELLSLQLALTNRQNYRCVLLCPNAFWFLEVLLHHAKFRFTSIVGRLLMLLEKVSQEKKEQSKVLIPCAWIGFEAFHLQVAKRCTGSLWKITRKDHDREEIMPFTSHLCGPRGKAQSPTSLARCQKGQSVIYRVTLKFQGRYHSGAVSRATA